MEELTYRSLVWLTYRLASTLVVGIPCILLIWALIKKESSIVRLLTIYWKVSSIFFISILLLTDQRSLGYILFIISPFLIVFSVWFWIDLNEEIDDLPYLSSLPLTVKAWRWGLTGFGVLTTALNLYSFDCIKQISTKGCNVWSEGPLILHGFSSKIFTFLFGGDWNESISAFIGYIALVIYILGLMQWILIKLPKQGRMAGDF